MKWILASGSPRRKDILHDLGCQFDVMTADTDETCTATDPAEIVCTLAKRKAEAVADKLGVRSDERLIIAADTLVACDGKVLGKPVDRDDAAAMLRMLSGRTHQVFSGVSLIWGDKQSTAFECTDVTFDTLTEQEIQRYVDSGEPLDKAGSYGIQGKAAAFIRRIDGCYFNVVGLPVHRLYRLLQEWGLSF